MTTSCAVCSTRFEAATARGRYCSDRCRQKAKRGRDAARHASDRESGLVAKVRRDLRAAGKLDTVRGELAIVVAEQIAKPDATGVQGLAKQLDMLLTALGIGEPASVAPSTSVEPDLMDEIKERRERKAREAAGHA